ncbi:MAG: phosphopantetheine-binding protein [Cyclobacteriaceae bacterium]|jgi:acyl carrier protein|nr:phosphopantetheine-binding protein [Cyclobacteriaceae bacterium]|tara:strand:- start:234 stop:488 length:255 start_codon:yes stop_codon:yes gene_type:complete
MDKNKIQEELKNIIAIYVPEKEILDNLTLEHDLINDLKINSAHIVDIVLDVEEKYDIMIEDDVIMQMGTIGQAIDVIHGKVQEK